MRAGTAVLVGVLVGAAAAGCRRKAESSATRAATRAEALAACMKGCLQKVEGVAGAAPTAEQRRTCDQICACIVDDMFGPTGDKQRKDRTAMPEVAVACAQRFAGAASAAAGEESDEDDEASSTRGEEDLPPRSKVVLGRKLIAGDGCRKGRLPKLAHDAANDRARLVGETFNWKLPKTWKARVERPDLLKVWGPPSDAGVYRVIELLVAPRCDDYDTQPVYERIAARGLIGLNKQAETVAQVRERNWTPQLGGRGDTEVASPVEIETPEGTKSISMYVTQVATTNTFSVFAAAVCPLDEEACMDAYRAIAIWPR